jgi:hypothetical protein
VDLSGSRPFGPTYFAGTTPKINQDPPSHDPPGRFAERQAPPAAAGAPTIYYYIQALSLFFKQKEPFFFTRSSN